MRGLEQALATERAMIAALADPARNIFGTHGPRCEPCSGLGQVLTLPSAGGPTTRSTSRCTCKGTGIDIETIQRQQIASLVDRLEAQERQRLRDLRRMREIEKRLGISPHSRSPKMSRQFWSELISWATADGASVNTTASETIVMPNITIPANFLQDGRALWIKAQGKHSTLGSGTVTLTFRLRWGGVAGTLICGTGAITQVVSLTNAFWSLEIQLQTRSNGSSGTVLANGDVNVYGGTAPTVGSATGAPATAPMTNGGQTAPAAATLDLTADTALALTVQMGASSASNIVIGQNYWLEAKN